ncbi:MAG: diacylglycerol kinase family protein [Trueperaceae bacterium]|nr:diacylglycerol kinase family protein [Trueperaceae bacterium]
MNTARLGLIVNPAAGHGAGRNLRLAAVAVAALRPERVFAGPGDLGADVLDVLDGGDVLEVAELARGGRAATQALAVAALRAGAEALVVVGGDGTLADVASALAAAGLRGPIVGVGAGSTNAGALVTCAADDVVGLAPERLRAKPVDGLHAVVVDGAGRAVADALAFNDVVLGTTIVGTLDGDFADLDAAAFLRGVRARGRARALACVGARVVKRGPGGDVAVASGPEVGFAVVGFTDVLRDHGKAIVGGVALSDYVRVPAGALVASWPLVFADFDLDDHRAMEPLRSAYVGLAADEVLELAGLDDGAYLCADGNPLWELHPDDRARVTLRRGVVDVARFIEGDR